MGDPGNIRADVMATLAGSASVAQTLIALGYRQLSDPHARVSMWVRSDDARLGTHRTESCCAAFFGVSTTDTSEALAESLCRDLFTELDDDPHRVIGHFAGFVATADTLTVLTDHVGSVSVHTAVPGGAAGVRVVGTNLADVAAVSNRTDMDRTSVFEFVQTGVVTYPHTIYDRITRLAPGSMATFEADGGGLVFSEDPYWRPALPSAHTDLDASAGEFAKAMGANLTGLAAHHDRLLLLMSGGEDSRALAHGLKRIRPVGEDVEAAIFLDGPNREWWLARTAAQRVRIRISARYREPDHLTKRLEQTVGLTGGGVDLLHAHSVGLLSDDEADLFIDGWAADSFHKGHTLNVRRRKLLGVQVSLDKAESAPGRTYPGHWHESGVGRRAIARREAKLDWLQAIRNGSPDVAAWQSLFPISDHPDFGMFATNWASRPTASPYMFANLVDISAALPPAQRLNRMLFQKACGARLGSAGWIPRTAGQIPRLSARANIVATPVVKALFRLSDTYQSWRGSAVAQGPWQSFSTRRAAVQEAILAVSEARMDQVDRLGRGLEASGPRPQAPDSIGGWSTDQGHRLIQMAELLDQTETAKRRLSRLARGVSRSEAG